MSNRSQSADTRQDRIEAIVDDCLLRRSRGEVITDAALQEAHPDLMPELGEHLQFLRMAELAERESAAPVHAREVAHRCPHCNHPFNVTDDRPFLDIVCPACGSHFNLIDDQPLQAAVGDPEGIGHFVFLDKLGVGAFGSVWRAHDTQLDRIVAVKIPREDRLSADDAEQFMREARVAAGLNHPHIVRVHEVGREGNRVYIVTDLVERMDLAEWLAEQRATPDEAARLCMTIADALHHAHQQRIIHRDLKPSNIMLDDAGQPYLMDFGLAKREAGEVTMTLDGKLIGTPAYMSPEQARSAGDVDRRTDIYSLGTILFELLTGERPFRGSTRMLLHQILFEEAPSPRRLNNRVPRDLETICLKCLEKDPHRRYQTAGELRDDLRRFILDEPVMARPIPKSARVWRWCRRNPALSTTLLALLLVATTGFLGVTWQWLNAEAQRTRAEALTGETRRERDRAESLAEDMRRQRDAARWQSYRANIAAASSDLQLHNVNALRRALDAAAPEYRGWEWHYLNSQLDRSLAVFTGHQFGVPHGVRFRDGNRRITSTNLAETIVWDRMTGQQIAVQSMIFSPDASEFAFRNEYEQWSGSVRNADGSRIASVPGDGSLHLIDARTEQPIAVLWQDTPNFVLPVFSSDGKLLASSCGDGIVRIWDAETGEERVRLDRKLPNLTAVMFSPDSRRLVSWLVEQPLKWPPNDVRLWDVTTGELVTEMHTAATGPIASVVFSPDSRLIVTGQDFPDNNIRLWDAETGERLAVMPGHENRVWCLAFNPDGSRLASGSMDQTVRLWDVASRSLITRLRGHTAHVYQVAFDSDGSRLASAGVDGTVRIWNADDGELRTILMGHTGSVARFVFSDDDALLATAAHDHTVRLWDVSWEEPGVLRGHASYIYDVAYSPDGMHVASASWDNSAQIHDMATGRRVQHWTAPSPLLSLAFSPDGRLLAAVSLSDGVYVWDRQDGSLRHVLPLKVAGSGGALAEAVAFNHDSTHLTAGGVDGTICVWDVGSGEEIARLSGHEGAVIDVCYSADGTRLVSLGGTTIRLWDAVTHQPLKVIQANLTAPTSVALSADSRLIVSTDLNTAVRLWDARTGDPLAVLDPRSGVYDAAFSPDGTRLATACDDGTIRLWDLATRDEVAALYGHQGYAHAVAFSPDGSQLASGSGDKTVRLWDTVPVKLRARPDTSYVPPKSYVAFRTPDGIEVDGRLDEPAWQAADWTDEFIDIEGPSKPVPRFRTRAKLLWDDDYLYVAAELSDPHVWATLTERDAIIFHDNDFELFLDPDGDDRNYGELEINALGTVWDLRLPRPYRDGGQARSDWDIAGLRSAVHVDGTINDASDIDRGWTVELAIPWTGLEPLSRREPPGEGDIWRINFSRVQWPHEVEQGEYRRVPDTREDNWVWSPQWAIDLHRPEHWGHVRFSTTPVGTGQASVTLW